MLRRAAPLLLASACSYGWDLGPTPDGGGGAASSSADASSTTASTSTASDGGQGGGGGPADCATLFASYESALAAAKVCSQSEVGVCDFAFIDACGCKVFLAHAETAMYPEIAAARQAKEAYQAAGCTPTCAACGPELVTGACSPVGMATACQP